MKTNILINNCIAFNKHIGSIYSRLDCVSIASRYRVLAIVVACLTVLGVGNAWGATTTYTFNSLSWGATSGGSAANWTSGKDANGFTSGQGVQVTSAKSGANATSPASFSNVSKIVVTYNTNKSAGAGTIKIKIGTNSEVSTAVQYHSVDDGTSADYQTTFRFEPRQSGSIKLTTDVTTNSIWIKEIEITYGNNASAYTVSFDAGNGTYAGSSITEGSANAGITLPNASPSSACASEGWAFYGWATAKKISSPTTAPEIVGKYGDKYYPTSSHTLYAVYASGEYTKITSSGDLTAGGKYLIVSVDGGGQNYIMSNTYTWVAGWGQLDGRAISETNTTSHTYSAAATYTGDVFTVETTASLSIATGDWMVKNVHDGYYVSPDYMDFYLDIDGESPDGNTIAVNTGNWTITNAYNSSSNKVYFDATNHLFTLTTSTASNLLIYKETTTPNYSSTPSCCDYEVSVSESGSSHITSMTFDGLSSTSVATCGDAASRTISITVTPASGYSLFGSTKPVFTKTSGTVTATIGSVTDNGNGTFSYECTFNSNDNGAGTFAISPGQFTNYRTVCCTELGDIDGDVNITTDGCDPGEIKVTWKMEATTGIASQTLKVYDENADEVTAKRITSITPSTSNQTKTISGLDPCKEYMVTIENVSSGGVYCSAGTPWESDVITTLGYTYTVNATNCQLKSTSDPVPSDMCEGDVLVYYEATGGSTLPDAITVTNAGAENTGWAWDSSDGSLMIDADAVTGNVTVTIFASCPGFSFHYGNDGDDASLWTITCFEKVKPLDATDHEWKLEDFTIPSKTDFYVGYQGSFKGSDNLGTGGASSATKKWTATPTYSTDHWDGAMILAPNDGYTYGSYAVGQATGATGTITIYDDSNSDNLFAEFEPDGYGISYSTSSYAFGDATSHVRETEVVTLPNVSTTYAIGLATATEGTYVKCAHSKSSDEAISAIGISNKINGKKRILFNPVKSSDDYTTSNAKIAIWDATNSAFYDFMTDTDDDGILEGEVPTTCVKINIVRLNSNTTKSELTNSASTYAAAWAKKWNQSSDITLGDLLEQVNFDGWCSGDGCKESMTTTAIHPTTGQTGKFRMIDNDKNQNWNVRFVPYYKLSYDANGGSGSTTATTRDSESSTQTVTVASNGFTAPTGYHFDHWDAEPDGSGSDYDANDSYTLSADATLYAIWAPNTNTAYTVKHYKQKLDGTYPASADDTDNLTGTTGASITPDRKSYTGFTAPSGTTTTILADGSRVVEYQYTRNSYTLSWVTDGDDLTGSYTSGSTKYEAPITAPNTPTKTGYTFAGWSDGSSVVTPASTMPAAATTYTATWTANTNTAYTVKHYKQKLDGTYDASPDDTDNLTGTTGASITPDRKSYEGFTAPSGTTTTILADGSRVVEYQYRRNSYNIAVQTISYVTIKATPTGESAISEGYNADAAYGNTITLNYSSKDSRYTWGGWRVTKADDASVSVCSSTSNNATFSMPAYAVKVTAYLYGDLKAWCDPDVTVTGDIYLTSTKDVPVRYSTSGSDNLVTISSSDMGSATTMEVAYLNADAADAEVDKDDSPFRFYKADGSATTETLDLDYEWETSHPISYTPSAYSVTNNYKLQLNFKKGDKVLKTLTHAIHGRGLPEEFVIAVKKGGVWVALPSNLASTSAQPSIIPRAITVNDNESPTTAIYAPTTTVYKAKSRGNDAHISTIRFTTTGSNYLQVSGTASEYNMWLSGTNSANVQDWQLKTSDGNAYEVTIPSNSTTKEMGIYNSTYMGYHGSPNNANIYFLPITNKYDSIYATVYEWGEHGAIIAPKMASLASLASATMHVANGSAVTATLTAVNAASLTAGKYIRVYNADLTVGDISNENKQLYVHWKNSGGTDIGVSQVTIPRVIASDRTANKTNDDNKNVWNTEVHVLPGATLTIDGNTFVTGTTNSTVSVNELYVYPGATINVSTGKLSASTLRLRNGWTRAGTKQYNTARVYINSSAALEKETASMDYDIYDASDGSKQHYYPLAVPFETAVSGIDYADSYLAGFSTYGTHYVVKKYDGANRAKNGENRDDNWVIMKDGTVYGAATETLQPGAGYIMTAVAVKGEAIIRVPLTFNNGWTSDGEKATYDEVTKNVVAVTAYGGAAATAHQRHKGWNMLGVPFMSCYGNVDDIYSGVGAAALINGELVVNTDADQNMEYQSTTIPYVSVPSHDFAEYVQTDIEDAKLLPGWSFFVQVNTSGNLTFAVNDRRPDEDNPIYAPKRSAVDEVLRTGIILSDGEASDKTTILISNRYSSDYEIGADLEKMFGNGYTLATYSLSGSTRLAYNAMSKSDATAVIPIGYRAPAEGEYTYSLNPRYAEANFERVDLIDYQTGSLTNLMTSSYTFTTGRTQDDSRFALNVVMKPTITTDVKAVSGERLEVSGVQKVIINDHMYIIRSGKMYDATGKVVKGGQK